MNLDQLYETAINSFVYTGIKINDRSDKFITGYYGLSNIPATLSIYIYFNRYVIYDFFNHQTTFFKYAE